MKKAKIVEIAVFGMLGAFLCASKAAMDLLPNIHLIGVMIAAMTAVYGVKTLFPIYVFVFLTGLINGFSLWWVPYLYIWTVLWAVLMPLRRLPSHRLRWVLGTAICTLHGLCYGTLYAPFQALAFGLRGKQILSWIVAGFPYDLLHAGGNLVLCLVLLRPITTVLQKLRTLYEKG